MPPAVKGGQYPSPPERTVERGPAGDFSRPMASPIFPVVTMKPGWSPVGAVRMPPAGEKSRGWDSVWAPVREGPGRARRQLGAPPPPSYPPPQLMNPFAEGRPGGGGAGKNICSLPGAFMGRYAGRGRSRCGDTFGDPTPAHQRGLSPNVKKGAVPRWTMPRSGHAPQPHPARSGPSPVGAKFRDAGTPN